MTKPFYSTNEIDAIRNDAGSLLWELHQAAAYGDKARVLECLDAGADVNGRNPEFGVTALMLAAAGGYWEIAKLLLDRGARLDITDHAGRTAETWAAARHREDLVELLRGRLPWPARTVHAAGAGLAMLLAYGPPLTQLGSQGWGAAAKRHGKAWKEKIFREVRGATLRFDLWRPMGAAGTIPLVVLVHGGGWNGGTRNELLAHGFAVATVDYRLAWDWRFPDPLRDIKAAVRHFRANAGEYRIDPERIGVFGHSAGAHLALLLGLTSAHPVLEEDSGDLAVPSTVRAVCGIACPCDFQPMLDAAEAIRAAVEATDPAERKAMLSSLAEERELASVTESMNIRDFPLDLRDLSEKETALLWQRKFEWNPSVALARGLVHAESEDLSDLLAKRDELLLASPLVHARRPSVAGPLPSFLLLHGGKDSLIPAGGCLRFREALLAHGADVDVRIDPESGHWHRDAFQLVPTFFCRTLALPQSF